MCISPCFADWYMVTSKNARFYDKNGKARGILFEGQVVEAIRHKWDRDLIHLKHKGKIYQAHKKDFKRELELLSELEDENLTAEASLTDLSRELELNFERLCLIIEAQKQATRDRSFYYPLDVEKHVDSETREVTFETVYMPVIDKTAYRELHQKWEDEEK